MSRFVQPFMSATAQGYAWPHRVAGTARVEGTGARKRIAIFEREAFQHRAFVVSEPDGSFLFRGLPELPAGHSGWLVIVQDNVLSDESGDGTFNAVVADMVQPETGD